MKSLAALRSKLRGSLYLPSDAEYTSAKRGNGTTPVADRFPAVVILVKGADDIARSIEFARINDIDFSIRSGGHDMLGASTTAGGVLIDLCCMDGVDLDPLSGMVRVGGGARSGAVTTAGEPFGLAPVLGMSPNVGIGGLALGGGIGWLSGTHGATVDHVLAVEAVTADGKRIKADARNETDLFWALRGGGGNFAVATAFTLQLQPVAQVLAGEISLKVSPAKLLHFMRDFVVESGDALDAEIAFGLGPDAAADIRLCWSGDPAEGDRMLRPLRTFAPIVRDTVKVQSFADFSNAEPKLDSMFFRGGEFDGLTERVAEAIAGIVGRGGPKGCTIGVLHFMHGALCRPPADTPFNRPFGHILYNVVAPLEKSRCQSDKIDWAIKTFEALKVVSSGRTYLNYLCEKGDEPIRAAFGPHFERLRAVKRRYDPDNIFHNTRNITP
jgi:FAD/FMN-containing dehydrogenase